jgi:hypothetical protein
MSVLGQEADTVVTLRDVGFVPGTDVPTKSAFAKCGRLGVRQQKAQLAGRALAQ